jgi:hypothetical protein
MNGGAADGSENLVRPESWWNTYDRNDIEDLSISKFLKPLLNLF